MSKNDLEKVEKLIVEHKWPVNQTIDANDRFSALTLACHLDFLEMVHLLDTIGADVNQGVGKFHNTPLMTATGRWNVRIVDYLIERGADPTKLDIYGFSARRKAEIKNLKTISSMLKQHETKFLTQESQLLAITNSKWKKIISERNLNIVNFKPISIINPNNASVVNFKPS